MPAFEKTIQQILANNNKHLSTSFVGNVQNPSGRTADLQSEGSFAGSKNIVQKVNSIKLIGKCKIKGNFTGKTLTGKYHGVAHEGEVAIEEFKGQEIEFEFEFDMTKIKKALAIVMNTDDANPHNVNNSMIVGSVD